MADTVTQVQTNIPDYARPYVESMLGRTHDLVMKDPPPQYTGQRIAGASGLQQQSYGAAAGMTPAPQLGEAAGMAQGLNQQAMQRSAYTPGQFSAQSVYASPFAPQTSTGQWGAGAMAQYMSPYQQGVIDIGKREALRQSQIAGQGDNAAAVGAGAFGGSRHAILQAERERNLGQQMNDIQMQGSNAAYTNAQQAFQADQGRSLQSQVANQGAGLQAAGMNLQGQMANQSAGLQAQQMGEQSRQFGGNLGIAGLQAQLGAAGLMKDIGTSQYNQQLGIAGLQNQFGTQQQMTDQAGLDHQYNEWQNTINWPYRQLEFQNSMNRGLPMSQSTSVMSTPSASPLTQMLGYGAAAYGLTKGMAGGGMVDVPGVVQMPPVGPRPVAAQMPATRGSGLADLLISQMGA
jgi:hypothetical protein